MQRSHLQAGIEGEMSFPWDRSGFESNAMNLSVVQASEASVSPSDNGGNVVNILIVDDEPKNLTVLETVLEFAALSVDPGGVRR